MGLFDFFKRRQERESAMPVSATEPLGGSIRSEPEPVGQMFPEAGPQAINLNLGSGQADVTQILGMVGEALRSGNFQVAQSENQVIDLQGSGLREEIMDAMREHGIDPEAAAGGQVNAGDYSGLQKQILESLEGHGVDLGAQGLNPPADGGDTSDGDGSG